MLPQQGNIPHVCLSEFSNEKSWNLEQHLVHANYHGIFPHLACHFSGGDLVEKALSETSNVNQCLTMNGSMDYLFRKQARGSLGFRTKRVIDHQEPIPSHEELQIIEKERRLLLRYEKSFVHFIIMTSTAFVNTLPRLLFSWMSISSFGLYIILRVLLTMNILTVGDQLPQINSTVMSVVGGFMSFFLVFFLSQAYNRFIQQYDLSMRLEGRIFNLCYLAKSSLSTSQAWRLMRYINAVHILGYIGLSTAYNDENLFEPLNTKYHFLTPNEVKQIRLLGMNQGGNAYREVIGWSVELIYHVFHHHYPPYHHLDINTMQIMINELLQLRGAMAGLYDYADQSFPYTHIHLMYLTCWLYLPLITYTIATYLPITNHQTIFPHLLGGSLLLLNLIFVIGLRYIGKQMMNPYNGKEIQSLSVLHYIEFTLQASKKILLVRSQYHAYPMHSDGDEEEGNDGDDEEMMITARQFDTITTSNSITTRLPSYHHQYHHSGSHSHSHSHGHSSKKKIVPVITMEEDREDKDDDEDDGEFV